MEFYNYVLDEHGGDLHEYQIDMFLEARTNKQISIEDLDITIRCLSELKNHDIEFLNQLTVCPPFPFNFTNKTLLELTNLLEKHNLSWFE